MTVKSIKELEPEKAQSLGRVGLKMFFKLADLWGLNQNEQLRLLGLSSPAVLSEWKSKAESDEDIRLPADTIERLSLVAGIQKSLELLFPKNYHIDYMRVPNTSFNGRSILDVMLAGGVEELHTARRYLDASRQSHYL